MVSAIDRARRSLVPLLQALAKTYCVVLVLTQVSSDAQTKTSVRKVSLKAQPVCFFQFAPPETLHGSGRFHFGSDRCETISRFGET